ncbi:MAG TPA: phospholipase D family protein [Caldimonas sp.]
MQRTLRNATIVGLGVALVACAGLPPRGTLAASQALAGSDDTPLARVAHASRPTDETLPSGFRLLPSGESAFVARVALAERAVQSIDAQYYQVQDDAAGQAWMRALRDAARRGVRVRLLVDDVYSDSIVDLLRALAAEPNVQVRLFNPLPVRGGTPLVRLALSWPDFERVNHRMHNKLFVADGAVAIFGGRNIGDAYFMRDGEANFVDLDVLSTGAVVRDLSAAFDLYWNSDQVWTAQALLGEAIDTDRAGFDRRTAATRTGLGLEPSRDVLGQRPMAQQLAETRLTLHFGTAIVVADPPDKAVAPPAHGQPSAAMHAQLEIIEGARSDVALSSPYFLPGGRGMQVLLDARRRGIQALVLTNSLGSTDEPLVYFAYAPHRAEMLRQGIELYELAPTLARDAGGFGHFGTSIARLHAKLATVDRRWLLVGSVNFDARSATINTEMGVAIDCPALAIEAMRVLAGDAFRSMYRLRLAADGENLEWVSSDADGRVQASTREPNDDLWLRLRLQIQSLFVSEKQL